MLAFLLSHASLWPPSQSSHSPTQCCPPPPGCYCCVPQKLLGTTWRPAPLPPNTRIISLDEYKRAKGWA